MLEMVPIRFDLLRETGGQIARFVRVVFEVVELGLIGFKLINGFPEPVAQTEKTQAVIGAEKREVGLAVEQRAALVTVRDGIAK